MAVTLTVRSGDVQVPPITLDSPRIVIGRGSSCELQLPDPSVSHRHASIRQRGSEYIVLDEGSTNGTFVGPVKLSPGAPRVLKQGDLLRIGRVWLQVALEHAAPSNNPADLTREIALGLVAGALELDGQPSVPRVIIRGGPDQGAELALEKFNKPYTVGRHRSAELTLTDEDISRRHVQVERRGARILLQDLGSKNGAKLDGEALQRQAQVVWEPGQTLEVGNSTLSLEDPLTETLHEIDSVPDEKIDDSVEPPSVDESTDSSAPAQAGRPKTEPADRASGASSSPPGADSKSAAKVVKLPRGRASQQPSKPASARTWGAADVMIAALALLVLGLSAAGMAWLFTD